MVGHEMYELILVHSHDYELLVHDILIFIFTGSWQCPKSYSWVQTIFMSLFMGSQFHVHGFIGIKKNYGFTTQNHSFHELRYMVHLLFMNNVHTTHGPKKVFLGNLICGWHFLCVNNIEKTQEWFSQKFWIIRIKNYGISHIHEKPCLRWNLPHTVHSYS